MEQYLVLPDLQVWINECNPTSAAEAASLADIFCGCPTEGPALDLCPMEREQNVYWVPGLIGQVHSGYGSGYGRSRLDQTASAFYLHFASERNYPNASV